MSLQVKPLNRRFVAKDLNPRSWEQIEPYVNTLLAENINSVSDLKGWLENYSELFSVLLEYDCRLSINISVKSNDKEAEESYKSYWAEIYPKWEQGKQSLNQKILESPFIEELEEDQYGIFLRNLKNQVNIFRKENIDLKLDEEMRGKVYGKLMGGLTVEIDGQEITLRQASKLLKNMDRNVRETAFKKMFEVRKSKSKEVHEILDGLLELRHQIAKNAGFENYRDYRFKSLNRFGYSPEDCFTFHESIKEEIVPLVDEILQAKMNQLNIEDVRPWDVDAEPNPLIAEPVFTDEADFIEKGIQVLGDTHPFFGEAFAKLREVGNLDLMSRKHKRPGGFNMSLPESGVPFIFMNAVNDVSDLRTLVHEAGHAVHSFLVRSHPLIFQRKITAETAELAAMGMELLTVGHWRKFFKTDAHFKMAHRWEIERCLSVLPWIATIDKFQHWLYTNPGHSHAERESEWTSIFSEFYPSMVDWTGLEDFQSIYWQRQLHLFNYPFYYIEYGIAQLGAIGVWKNYSEDPEKAIHDYQQALKLAGTKTISEVYKTANVGMGFNKSFVADLRTFVSKQLTAL